jgi:OmpR family response regulator RpaB
MKKILLIDDDERLAPPLAEYFLRYDLELHNATHPQQGLEQITTDVFDLVILDIMLPDMDGFEVCRALRKDSEIPIIMLTARGEVMDRIVGLELGADDYLPKPFEPRELVARIQNILKRRQPTTKATRALDFGGLQVDLDSRQVSVNGATVGLTSKEYQLLTLLIEQPGRVFSRDDILNHLRGMDADLYSRAVDIAISRLRHKLKPLDCIKTHWGAGYSFARPAT